MGGGHARGVDGVGLSQGAAARLAGLRRGRLGRPGGGVPALLPDEARPRPGMDEGLGWLASHAGEAARPLRGSPPVPDRGHRRRGADRGRPARDRAAVDVAATSSAIAWPLALPPWRWGLAPFASSRCTRWTRGTPPCRGRAWCGADRRRRGVGGGGGPAPSARGDRAAAAPRAEVAEREGFEPSVEGLPLLVISSHADSTTLASLRLRSGGAAPHAQTPACCGGVNPPSRAARGLSPGAAQSPLRRFQPVGSGGEGGIRTHGTFWVQRFSRPPDSTTLAPLRAPDRGRNSLRF